MKKVDLPQPTLLLKPFCESGTKNTLPVTNTDTGNPQLADLTNGFPIITQGSPDDGKLPPERADFNGLGYLTTTYDFFYQAGGTFTFNSTISTAIGGYPLGARLWHTNAGGVSMILRSAKDDNTDDFTLDESYIGTSWIVESFVGIENSSISLLDYKFSDKTINSMSWLLGDGTWYAGSTYSNVMSHLNADIAFMPTNTPSIVVGTNGDFTVGTYTRSSGDDEVDAGITYYAWKYGSDVFYVTVDIDAMTGAEAFEALQGQRIYKKDGSFVLTIHKVCKITTQNDGTNDFTVYVGSDGHLIVDADDLASVDTVYNNTGVAWYYVLDNVNNKFKLPRTKWGFVGNRGNVGKYVSESLPNIKGSVFCHGGFEYPSGAFTIDDFGYRGTGGDGGHRVLNFDASLVSSAYQDSAPVQERATEMYLYFYVGAFNDTAISQTAGITASTINAKLDIDLSNATQQTKEVISGAGIPDYSSGITISAGASGSYTALTNGLFVFSGVTQNAVGAVYVNGEYVGKQSSGGAYLSLDVQVNVSKDDVITWENVFAGGLAVFYPLKGVV